DRSVRRIEDEVASCHGHGRCEDWTAARPAFVDDTGVGLGDPILARLVLFRGVVLGGGQTNCSSLPNRHEHRLVVQPSTYCLVVLSDSGGRWIGTCVRRENEREHDSARECNLATGRER